MRELLTNIFTQYSTLIVFFHILSAIIWVGGMIVIRVAVHPQLQSIKDNKLKLQKTLLIIGNLFNLVLPFIIILIITATIMAVGLEFKTSPFYWLIHIKELIWTLMSINFTYMYIKRKKAQNFFDLGNFTAAKEQISKFANILLPINTTLGIFAIYAGVTLRGI